jgi:hypothetical protein
VCRNDLRHTYNSIMNSEGRNVPMKTTNNKKYNVILRKCWCLIYF